MSTFAWHCLLLVASVNGKMLHCSMQPKVVLKSLRQQFWTSSNWILLSTQASLLSNVVVDDAQTGDFCFKFLLSNTKIFSRLRDDGTRMIDKNKKWNTLNDEDRDHYFFFFLFLGKCVTECKAELFSCGFGVMLDGNFEGE
jgi:hypothetical protein